ncbi:metallophosphoesterase [Palleronia sediminis]|uniref:Metallophosphoesterase n=1 Tax=Palleronia sediminis TaxID=2547833 RepID=A0A4R6AEI1_9RHOB|nr:metallophosphoesterase [Palleronia sediminis]TDL81364.1 metallophosphoesterase [Palleronia sediminis]
MANWYTADLHLNHQNVIRYCNRPFATAAEMDRAYIETLKSCIGPRDDLWILGDVAMIWNAPHREYIAALFREVAGRKHLVTGNHDNRHTAKLGWASVQQIAELRDDGTRLVLCHYPMLSWPRMHNGAVHLFGHVHTEYPGYRGAVNVGVDQWDHRPVRIDEILDRERHLPERPRIV